MDKELAPGHLASRSWNWVSVPEPTVPRNTPQILRASPFHWELKPKTPQDPYHPLREWFLFLSQYHGPGDGRDVFLALLCNFQTILPSSLQKPPSCTHGCQPRCPAPPLCRRHLLPPTRVTPLLPGRVQFLPQCHDTTAPVFILADFSIHISTEMV